MKKIISLLLVLVISLGLFTACGQEKAVDGTFTVGFDASYPPYGYMDENGEYTGFDLDLAQEVCNRRGWTLVKQPIDWNAKDNELNSGNIDCIWNGFTRNAERENQYTWSDYYVNNSIVLLVRKDSGFKAKADLAGKILDVQAASSGATALEKDAEFTSSLAKVIEVSDYNTAVMDLQSGAVDAIAIDIGVAEYQCNIHDDIMIMEEALNTEKYAIGFKKDNVVLRDLVQETLYKMVEDGTFAKIAEKYGLENAVCLTLPDADTTEENSTFTVGFDASYPPYGYMDENGEYTGFDLDLAQEVCNRRGWTLVKQPIDWNSKDAELNSGNIDCIWNGFTRNAEREEQYTWSDYYVNNSIVLLVRKDSGFKAKADLAGKILDVQAASSGATALEKDAEFTSSLAQVIEVSDYNTAVMDLQSGAVDAVAIDIGVAEYQCNIHDDIMIMEEALNTEKYAIGFKKDNTALRDLVQETLYEMVEDGTFAKIAEEYGLTDSVCLGK